MARKKLYRQVCKGIHSDIQKDGRRQKKTVVVNARYAQKFGMQGMYRNSERLVCCIEIRNARYVVQKFGTPGMSAQNSEQQDGGRQKKTVNARYAKEFGQADKLKDGGFLSRTGWAGSWNSQLPPQLIRWTDGHMCEGKSASCITN